MPAPDTVPDEVLILHAVRGREVIRRGDHLLHYARFGRDWYVVKIRWVDSRGRVGDIWDNFRPYDHVMVQHFANRIIVPRYHDRCGPWGNLAANTLQYHLERR